VLQWVYFPKTKLLQMLRQNHKKCTVYLQKNSDRLLSATEEWWRRAYFSEALFCW